MDPLISVVVPVYKVEQYVQYCIESIINQTYKNLEVILVNDGSPDNSGLICDEYAKRDNRIKVIHKNNGGRVSARTAGIEIANGEYIGFVDSDDWIDGTMYEHMLKIMLEYNVEMVDVGIFLEYENNQKIWFENEDTRRWRYGNDSECSYSHMFFTDQKGTSNIVPSICNKLFKTEILKYSYLNIPDVQQSEDSAYVYGYIPFVDAIYISSKVLYHYNQTNDKSICRDRGSRENSIPDIMKVYFYLKKIYENHEARANLLIQLDKYLLNLIFDMLPQSLYNQLTPYYFSEISKLDLKACVVYGAGEVGRSYIKQFRKNKEISIVNVVDKNKAGQCMEGILIKDIEVIENKKFDFIVVAIKDEIVASNIKKDIIQNYGIDESKILWKRPIYIAEKIFDLY